MSIIFDPADRSTSQNTVQGNLAQGGAAQNSAAQKIPASVRNAVELNPMRRSLLANRWRADPLSPTLRYRVTPLKSSRVRCSSPARVP